MNQALMDFGSSICIANGNPRCNICFLMDHCQAYKEGKVHLLPIRKKQKNVAKKNTPLPFILIKMKCWFVNAITQDCYQDYMNL